MRRIYASDKEKLATLQACPYFATVSDSVLAEFIEATSRLQFERGEMVTWQDENCSGLFVLKQGSVKLFKISPQGRELIVRVLMEEATFNEVPVFDGGVNPINVAALEDSEIWIVERQAIQTAMYKHPEMCKAVTLNLCSNLRKMVSIIEELSFYQVTNRLARLISQDSETGSVEDVNQLTQDQLAARLGTVREVISRSLRELERSGAIQITRRQIQVTDESILNQWAQIPTN